MAPNDNFISKTVQSGVSAAGGFAGGVVDSAGKAVSGTGRSVGEGLTNATNSAGAGVSDYGNAVKDWTGADGPRTSTAKNPVGITDSKSGGKRAVTSATKGSGAKTGVSAGSYGGGTAQNPLGLSK